MAGEGRRPVAPPVAKKAPASEDQVRAVVGAAFFLLSLYYVISTIAKMAKAARTSRT